MQIAFGRVRRKTSPAEAREVGVRNPSHRLLKCPCIFGLYYKLHLDCGLCVVFSVRLGLATRKLSLRGKFAVRKLLRSQRGQRRDRHPPAKRRRSIR